MFYVCLSCATVVRMWHLFLNNKVDCRKREFQQSTDEEVNMRYRFIGLSSCNNHPEKFPGCRPCAYPLWCE